MLRHGLAFNVAAYLLGCTVVLAQRPAIEQKLAPEEISLALSFDVAKGVPDTFAVTYTNTSAARGYIELPSPLLEELHSEYREPSLALSFEESSGDELSRRGAVFLLAPSGDARSPRATIAILDPKASIRVEYKTAAFCLIGHGIAPDPDANVSTCFKPGKVAMKVRALLITDWKNPQKHASEPENITLSAPDLSKHHDFRDAISPSSR
jgi:hypothetical protein